MLRDTTDRSPDLEAVESGNVAWSLLPRKQSSDVNMTILVQRFDPGGSFEEHSHDLEQYFYITRGQFEMTINNQSETYQQGDFVMVGRNEPHSGRNICEGVSELLAVDYWPKDSHDRLGLD